MTQEEFEHIAPSLRELMLSVGRSFFGNDNDAEDVAQEGLVALLRYIDWMEPDARHDALAIRVAKHCCVDIVRKRKSCLFVSRKMNERTAPPDWDVGATPHEVLEAKELHEAVNRAIQHLKPGERRLFEMRQMEGLELDEIARRTQMEKTSVKSIVSAARKKVFEEIKRFRT
ncbi:MAG: RNA polymerase sigma factor [Prevotella sp.]|nr:RNA polymerase sigma factor [Prevotella sp.]